MHANFIEYGACRVHYYYAERGPRLVVCFHGYDEDGLSFDMLGDVLPAACSVLSIDLPHHGGTVWHESETFDALVLWKIIGLIRGKLSRERGKIELAGFSLGGRIALSACEANPRAVDRMILLAPDGLSDNFWYRLSTRTIPGRILFKFTVRHPTWLLLTLRVANKLRIINPALFKFSYFYLKDQVGRNRLYQRWMSMRMMTPNVRKMKQVIHDLQIPVLLIYGSFDRIMQASAGVAFCRDMHNLCKVEMIPCGHQILQLKNKKNLAKIFRRLKF
jgi:pimeloyl-ACP methyl ester carboxylesterase